MHWCNSKCHQKDCAWIENAITSSTRNKTQCKIQRADWFIFSGRFFFKLCIYDLSNYEFIMCFNHDPGPQYICYSIKKISSARCGTSSLQLTIIWEIITGPTVVLSKTNLCAFHLRNKQANGKLIVTREGEKSTHCWHTNLPIDVKLDRVWNS